MMPVYVIKKGFFLKGSLSAILVWSLRSSLSATCITITIIKFKVKDMCELRYVKKINYYYFFFIVVYVNC